MNTKLGTQNILIPINMNDTLKELQKRYGVKLGKYDSEKNRLFNQGLLILKATEEYIKQVEKAKMTGESFFLDWEDDLNLLSIKDHNVDSK